MTLEQASALSTSEARARYICKRYGNLSLGLKPEVDCVSYAAKLVKSVREYADIMIRENVDAEQGIVRTGDLPSLIAVPWAGIACRYYKQVNEMGLYASNGCLHRAEILNAALDRIEVNQRKWEAGLNHNAALGGQSKTNSPTTKENAKRAQRAEQCAAGWDNRVSCKAEPIPGLTYLHRSTGA